MACDRIPIAWRDPMADARGMGLSMGFGVLGFPRWRQRVVFPFQYLSNIVVYGWQFAHAPQAPDLRTFLRYRTAHVGVSAQKVEVFKKGSRADFLHYTASIVMVDHGSTRNTPRR